jgi:hypothetical protein
VSTDRNPRQRPQVSRLSSRCQKIINLIDETLASCGVPVPPAGPAADREPTPAR